MERARVGRDRFDAAVFDLDGVITRTARLHASAWKAMFDEFLAPRGEAPFDPVADYLRYVDGKPRDAGTRSFLEARAIPLPPGAPHDAPGTPTVCGLGKRKNELFLALLEREGAEPFPSSIELVKRLRAAGFRTAVISSSRNCAAVLRSVGALALFDARLDGNDLQARGLEGKPAPDMFLAVAAWLGVPPARALAVEDALAGVAAARAAGFGLVIGVDRAGQAEALRMRGADLVVADLAEIVVSG